MGLCSSWLLLVVGILVVVQSSARDANGLPRWGGERREGGNGRLEVGRISQGEAFGERNSQHVLCSSRQEGAVDGQREIR